jgi:hypothetical protein
MNKLIVKYESEYGKPPSTQVAALGEAIAVKALSDLPAGQVFAGWKAGDTGEVYQPGDEIARLPYEDAFSIFEHWDWNCSMEIQEEFDHYLISHIVVEWLKLAAPNDTRVMQQLAFWERNREESKNNLLFTLNSRQHSIFRDRSPLGWV